MANKKQWPAWMYGPDGQSRIFQEDDPVPAGWVDHPSKVGEEEGSDDPPALKVENGGASDDDSVLDGAKTIPEIEEAYAEGRITLDEIEAAEAERSRPRDGIAEFVETERSRLEARSDALSVLREAGVEIGDDATDEELSAALDALED